MLHQHYFKLALEQCFLYLSVYPFDIYVLFFVADCYLALNNTEKSFKTLQTINDYLTQSELISANNQERFISISNTIIYSSQKVYSYYFDIIQRKQIKLQFFNNLSIVQICLNQYSNALNNMNNALSLLDNSIATVAYNYTLLLLKSAKITEACEFWLLFRKLPLNKPKYYYEELMQRRSLKSTSRYVVTQLIY